MRSGKSALIGSISHEVETYGPRLIQLGIALLRGHRPALQLCPAQSGHGRNLGAEAAKLRRPRDICRYEIVQG